ncbi:hypothetical protein VKT23_016116 [Stygiomarasmius scandens]|uniref:Uncharacterized protein n=1 Tax=Marasmiellus scandens TaxID=2682957 RepID=A0ABR1IZ65_9AGAR
MTSFIIYHTLETPHRSNSDVVANLLREGSRLLFGLFVYRIFSLTVSIVGDPPQIFSIISIGWAFNAATVSRIHLRLLSLGDLKDSADMGRSDLEGNRPGSARHPLMLSWRSANGRVLTNAVIAAN